MPKCSLHTAHSLARTDKWQFLPSTFFSTKPSKHIFQLIVFEVFSQWDHCLVSFLLVYLFNLWQGLAMLPSGASNFWRAGAMDTHHHTTSILFLLLKELNQNQRSYSCIFSFLCDGRWFCICLKMFLFLSFRIHQAHFYVWALRDALPRNWGCTEEEKKTCCHHLHQMIRLWWVGPGEQA